MNKLSTLLISALTALTAAAAGPLEADLSAALASSVDPNTEVGKVFVKKATISPKSKSVTIDCNENTSYLPFSKAKVDLLKDKFAKILGNKYAGYKITVNAGGRNIESLILGAKKLNKAPSEKDRFVSRLDFLPETPSNGLDNQNIALWQSHGWYFEPKLNRWEWQRARLFQTVEDLYTQSYVVPFLVPMLENAGAYVMMPRERDMTPIEIIIDNDDPNAYAESSAKAWKSITPGFADSLEFYTDKPGQNNPFELGSARMTEKHGQTASWNAEMPQRGTFAVYVSYKTLPKSTKNATYRVNAANGPHDIAVNQQMGSSTWVYIGSYPFNKGLSEKPLVELISGEGTTVADAVKIGGGMGNIARGQVITDDNGNSSEEYVVSGYPRFTEGARYWLQWAGMPDSVYIHNPEAGPNDYRDDYTSRAKWVNYLAGGSSMYPSAKGLNIPVSLSFAFHSDAGTTPNDSIIGTLGIYSTDSNNPTGNGSSRLASRDLTDLVVTQIVNDVRALHEPNWTRRGLWDKEYYEARAPKVPAMLLELLSHQNFADMKYGLDPEFRFTVSRAIYKGMLRFLAERDNRDAIIQPLPVNSMNIAQIDGSNRYLISWQPTPDPIEPTAMPRKYAVEHRVNDGDFARIAVTESGNYTFDANDTDVHSFRIIAINDGGVSFPGETLALCHIPSSTQAPALIVNGFTRISAPDTFDAGSIAGFYSARDGGVPYIKDISLIGNQFEFRRDIPWMDDDAAGFGASRADMEDKIVAGNTFDYVALHGMALKNAGLGFVSSSLKAFCDNPAPDNAPSMIDLILGKQKEVRKGTGAYGTKYQTWPAGLRAKIKQYADAGTDIFANGAYVASGINDNPVSTDSIDREDAIRFADQVLGYKWRVGQATVIGEIYEVPSRFSSFGRESFEFASSLNADTYAVESPDSFYASDDRGTTIMRYTENNLVAATASDRGTYRTVILGIPFEAIISNDARNELMRQIVSFFSHKSENK